MTDRDAMHILTATAEALSISVDDLVLNRSTLRDIREQNRFSSSDEAKSELIEKVILMFNLNSYCFQYIVKLFLVFNYCMLAKRNQKFSSSF